MSPRVLRIARGWARSSGACNLHWCQMSAVCAVVWSDAGSTALRCAQIIGHALRQWHARPEPVDECGGARAARVHARVGTSWVWETPAFLDSRAAQNYWVLCTVLYYTVLS